MIADRTKLFKTNVTHIPKYADSLKNIEKQVFSLSYSRAHNGKNIISFLTNINQRSNDYKS
ncbi:hypothetical protein BWD42_13185 [Sphingobacterium sp. CZ-UAM]|nr:hypothetical protein BWD42_13185 [Sphingobacterium sp. CZ-UAM]